jgi:cytochrome c556
MSHIAGRLATTMAAAFLILGAGTATAQDMEGSIKYRQALMKGNAGHAGAIAQIVKGKVAFTDHLAGHAHALHELSEYVTVAFKERALSDKSRAKENIWKDWGDFEQKAKDLESATGKLADAAKAGDMGAVGESLQATFESCKGCHKTFRAKKK